MSDATTSALAIAAAVRAGKTRAHDVVAGALERIARRDATLNAFTSVLRDRALADADAIDHRLASGADAGPLAGVPFAAKNLFDIAGVTTLAGSKINADNAPATRDATAVARLRTAGAVLVGALNMDEYAYGFSTENTHYGPTRNPHDPSRIAGGSSGGSAAAVAAGLVPLSLGTDTNGSIRVPAALCGVFGLKPTFGRVSRAGVVPLAWSFDPVLVGHFAQLATDEALAAVARVARALGVRREVTLVEPERARAAAQVITACEAATYHLDNLRSRAGDFDPMTRDRLLAATLLPATYYLRAQRFREWFRGRAADVFRHADVLLAPTTPWPAPAIGAPWTTRIGGTEVPTRGHLGVFTQPLSFIGLPAMSVPVVAAGALPVGVQLIAAPFNEAALFRVAARLEAEEVVSAPVV